MIWDVFLSHASEDKDDIARPLAVALRARGLRVWFDEFELKMGDSLHRSIERGLSECDYGVVILSPNFFAKKWPRYELDGLVARDSPELKIILPVWHNISEGELRRHSPILVDRLASHSSDGTETIADEILERMGRDRGDSSTRRMESDDALDWKNPLAPLTLANLMAFAGSKDPAIDWSHHSPLHYSLYRRLFIVTMAQLVEAIEDQEANALLLKIYRRLLGRDTDWAGVFAHQPAIFLLGQMGYAFVEQQVLASREYRERLAVRDAEGEK